MSEERKRFKQRLKGCVTEYQSIQLSVTHHATLSGLMA